MLGIHDTVFIFLSLAIMISFARLFGELANHYHLPAVLGEILAGVLLGPTLLGAVLPGVFDTLFPSVGGIATLRESMATLAIALFLLVAGMEVNLSSVLRLRKQAAVIGFFGMAVPFLLGFFVAFIIPSYFGKAQDFSGLLFSLFFATALSISALPVIAKVLMDINLYRSDFGMVIISSAVMIDLLGWVFFAIILGLIGAGIRSTTVILNVFLILLFTIVILTLGRRAIHRLLPWLDAYTKWPGGVLVFTIALALFAATFTEWIGIHALFGAFIVGVAIGDSSHLREHTRSIISQFVSYIFAPLFFVNIGLQIDFIRNFDLDLILVVSVLAVTGKITGCLVGGRISGFSIRESLGIGFGLSARGAMEIVLGMLALQFGIINVELFVALVIMALFTSILSGPMMQKILIRRRSWQLVERLRSKFFVKPLMSVSREEAIRLLCLTAGKHFGQNFEDVTASVLERELAQATGVGNGIALPHAQSSRLDEPVIVVGIAERGIDFDAPDGIPVKIVFLILVPENDRETLVEIQTDIARTFSDSSLLDKVANVRNFTEFLAALKARK